MINNLGGSNLPDKAVERHANGVGEGSRASSATTQQCGEVKESEFPDVLYGTTETKNAGQSERFPSPPILGLWRGSQRI